MYYAILEYYNKLMQFMDTGGPVLWLIALLTFLMWSAIFERFWYFHSGLKRDVSSAVSPASMKPASVLYMGCGKLALRASNNSSPRVTSTIIQGAIRG